MNLTRRDALAAFAAMSGVTALSACGGRLPPIDVTASGFGRDSHGTISVWCRSATQTGIQAMIDAFHESQDRIRVDLTPVLDSQYVTKLATAIRGGRPPDLVDIDDINSALFIYRDAFADLTEVIEGLPGNEQLSPGHLGLATRDDRYYGAPFLADNSVLWANLELLDRAGLALDDVSTSFDGYLEAARATAALDGEIYGWSYPGNAAGSLGFTVQPHIWAADTDLIAGEIGEQRGNIAGNETLRQTLEFLRTLWDEDLVPPGSFADDGSRGAYDFVAGRVAFRPHSIGVIVPDSTPEFLQQVDVRLLSGPNGGTAFFSGGDNMCLPNGAQNPSAAWEFVEFCLDVAQQETLPAAGYTPIRADAATPEFREEYPYALPPLEDIGAGYAPLTLSYNRIYNQCDGPWLEMVRQAVFDGEVEQAMATAQQRWDEILRQGDA